LHKYSIELKDNFEVSCGIFFLLQYFIILRESHIFTLQYNFVLLVRDIQSFVTSLSVCKRLDHSGGAFLAGCIGPSSAFDSQGICDHLQRQCLGPGADQMVFSKSCWGCKCSDVAEFDTANCSNLFKKTNKKPTAFQKLSNLQ